MIGIISMLTVIINAIIIMSILLNINPRKLTTGRNIFFFCGIFAIIVIQILAYNIMGYLLYAKYYMLLAQLPAFLLFWIVSKRGLLKVVFVVLTTIFMSFPAQLIGQINKRWFDLSPAVVLILTIVVQAAVIFLIWKYMKPGFNYILDTFDNISLLKFSAIPLLYNLIILNSGGYVFEKEHLGLRTLISLSTLFAYFLMLNMMDRVRELENLKFEKHIMEVQLTSAQEKMESVNEFTEQAAIYRHDLRHHLGLISNYIENGQIEKTKDYLNQVQSGIEKITPIRFCENTAVNLIVSSFDAKAKNSGISLTVKANMAKNLCIPETLICTVLSNGLENAIYAVDKVEDPSLRKIYLECVIEENMLLIEIANAFIGQCKIVDGIPVATEAGHGYGCRSMFTIAEKQKGHCLFKAEDGIFTLKIVLPLNPDNDSSY